MAIGFAIIMFLMYKRGKKHGAQRWSQEQLQSQNQNYTLSSQFGKESQTSTDMLSPMHVVSELGGEMESGFYELSSTR